MNRFAYLDSRTLNNHHPSNYPTLQSANHPNFLPGVCALVKAAPLALCNGINKN